MNEDVFLMWCTEHCRKEVFATKIIYPVWQNWGKRWLLRSMNRCQVCGTDYPAPLPEGYGERGSGVQPVASHPTML